MNTETAVAAPPAIAMDAVESSQIKAIGYDAASRTLAVEFIKRGKNVPAGATSLYHYAEVPASEHADFMAAVSKGQHLDAHIKGKFAYTRIS
jgi:hypothetical protein